MSKPREWTVYVKLGRVLGEPRMDAEAVKVREVTPQDEAREKAYSELLCLVKNIPFFRDDPALANIRKFINSLPEGAPSDE